MKHLYTVSSQVELNTYQTFVHEIQPSLNEYIAFLKKEYAVKELPRAIIWTSMEIATHLISDIPLPAYTNEFRTIICPSLETWRQVYLKQLEPYDGQEPTESVQAIRSYYENALSQKSILQILGHELAHHSDLFPEDFNDYFAGSIWFEEGMVEYISRRYFYTNAEFDAEAAINARLVELYKSRFGCHSLDAFGQHTYEGNYAGIFFEYWRSFLAVQQIVAERRGDVQSVFRSYHQWYQSSRAVPLTKWFHVSI